MYEGAANGGAFVRFIVRSSASQDLGYKSIAHCPHGQGGFTATTYGFLCGLIISLGIVSMTGLCYNYVIRILSYITGGRYGCVADLYYWRYSMRNNIPENAVNLDYHGALNHFISLLIERQESNIKCVYLSGSYARGDATDASDLDLFCVFDTLTDKALSDVGFSARNTPISYENLEINTQCLSINEFNREDFKGWTEKPARILDSVLIFGEDIFGNDVSTNELEKIYKKYLTDVLMSIRHYISVDEPIEKLTYRKIKTYILKPLMFPLRMERYCTTGSFPLAIDSLKNALDESDKFVVDFFCSETDFNEAINENYRTVLYKFHNVVLKKLT